MVYLQCSPSLFLVFWLSGSCKVEVTGSICSLCRMGLLPPEETLSQALFGACRLDPHPHAPAESFRELDRPPALKE